MLVLSRKAGERIHIGENITLTIVRIGSNNVRIGIDAPRELNIVRDELVEVTEAGPLSAHMGLPTGAERGV